MKLFSFILVLIFNSKINTCCFGQSSFSKTLLENSVIVYDTNGKFSEDFIRSFKNELKNVRVVSLGEASHEDGSTFEQKVNLVKLLHRELGFEVIAFEYGFFGNWKTNNMLKSGAKVKESTKYSGWSKSIYTYPLYEYIAESLQSDFPLQLAGFDSEKVPDGIPNISNLITELSQHFQIEFPKSDKDLLDSLIAAIYGAIGNNIQKQLSYDQRIRAKNKINEFHLFLSKNKKDLLHRFSDSELIVWDYTLQSVLMDEKSVFAGSFWNIVRDKNMAERIIMLADSIYKGKKIILWGASAHFARNMISIDRNLPENSYGYFPYYQTGDWLFKHFGNQYYSIAFIAGEGTIGTIFPDDHRLKKYEEFKKLDRFKPNSYEVIALQTGVNFLFTSLRNQKSNGWLNKPFISYPLGYQEDFSNWKNIFDSFFFIRKMKPDQWFQE